MMDFLIYDGKVAVALTVFYMFYRLLLKKETFHRLNRLVLVGMVVASFLLPLCIITIHKPMEMAPVGDLAPMDLGEEMAAGLAPVATATENAVAWWTTALAILFFAGVTFVLGRVTVSILSIVRIVRRGQLTREEDGCKIIVTDREIDPFSWMRYIVLPRKDWEGQHDSIITHEKAHIAYGHSSELLLVDILSAFQWFNPAIWMLRMDLQELHEYEADDAVLRSGANLKEYQYLLIRKAVSKSGYSVANSFNHSILKNRITMMSKSKSPLSRGLRVLYLLPLVCLGIGLQARTVYVPLDKDSEKILLDEKKKGAQEEIVVVTYADASVTPDQIKHAKDAESNKSFALQNPEVDTPPVFSEKNFSAWLNSRIAYPKGCLYEGTLVAGFTVNEKGKVEGVRVLRGLCEELDNLIVGLIKQSPDWTPGFRNGNPVAFNMLIPVTFAIRTSKANSASTQPEAIVLNVRADGKIENGGKVYTVTQLKDIITPHEAGQPLTTVQIVAADDVRLGAVRDVKDELRKLGSLKIQYASPTGQEGTTRNMPPFPSSPKGYPEEYYTGEKSKNVCIVRINSADRVIFGDKVCSEYEEMLRLGEGFLRERGNEARFCLVVDRGTSYGAYRHMQELLFKVYEDIRNEKALEQYGKPLSELSTEERNQINWQVPFSISEAETKKAAS